MGRADSILSLVSILFKSDAFSVMTFASASKDIVRRMVENDRHSMRYTGLAELLREAGA